MASPKTTHPDMWLIVGLGNPDEEYAHTRHNAGFDAVDLLADQAGVHYWKSECGALTGSGTLAGEKVLIAKPQSYMNTSGGPVKKLCRKYHVLPDALVVLHDDMDIEPGHIRVRFGGSPAGHNGIRSICDKLQTRDWYRIRCGTGHPAGRKNITDYVLSRPRGQEAELFAQTLDLAAQATKVLITDGLTAAQQQFN